MLLLKKTCIISGKLYFCHLQTSFTAWVTVGMKEMGVVEVECYTSYFQKIIFNNIYLSQDIKNIILTCNQPLKIISEFLKLYLWNPVRILLKCPEHISLRLANFKCSISTCGWWLCIRQHSSKDTNIWEGKKPILSQENSVFNNSNNS